LYTVFSRCDGGYLVLRFKKNEFYFYSPQEGTNYIIKDIKYSNDSYIINTTGYYFLKGENILKQNDTWFLEKQDDLLWTFKNKNWDKNITLSDSLNINRRKINYKIQPCRECYENCEEPTVNNNLIGNWKINCDSPIGISIKENEITITVEPNQFYIHLNKMEGKNKATNDFQYKLKKMEGFGSKDIDSDVYYNDKEVAIVK
ncbi:hypothetical protein AB4Y90_18135, partial [Chryseobacterium sp. 2TAF14]|uniref:hypothetical protein n=1 Tax=Chryseobacterium sp. 2TAF14 TaxID=3233007 RepID=UPI003F92BC2C